MTAVIEGKTASAVRLGRKSALAIALASAIGVIAFGWPLLAPPGSSVIAHANDAPWIFGIFTPVVLFVVLAQIADRDIEAKGIALLGVLAAVIAVLRPLGGGLAGLEPIWVVLILAGRALGPGFGFALGSISLCLRSDYRRRRPMATVPDDCGCVGWFRSWHPSAKIHRGGRDNSCWSVCGIRLHRLWLHHESLVLALLNKSSDTDCLCARSATHGKPGQLVALQPHHVSGLRLATRDTDGSADHPRWSTHLDRPSAGVAASVLRHRIAHRTCS